MTTELAGARYAAEPPANGPDDTERMKGLAILGVTFESGHTLALRRFEETSFGPGFTAVWMREPGGDWRFFSDNDPGQSCAKYMLPDLADRVPIDVRWVDDRTLHVSIKAISFRWFIEFEETGRTRLMSRLVSRIPKRGMRTPAVSRFVAFVAGKGLGAGKLRLRGAVPNGQHFAGIPRKLWQVRASNARTAGYDFGEVVWKAEQEQFGDFWIPVTPIAMAGEVEFATRSRVEVRPLSLAA